MNFVTIIISLVFVIYNQESQAATLSQSPLTLKAQLNVSEGDPQGTQYLEIKTTKDGKLIGLIVKRRSDDRRRQAREVVDEIIEIIGTRVPDDTSDKTNVYRNAKIVNNKLITQKYSERRNV